MNIIKEGYPSFIMNIIKEGYPSGLFNFSSSIITYLEIVFTIFLSLIDPHFLQKILYFSREESYPLKTST